MQNHEPFTAPSLSSDEVARYVRQARALRSQALNHWIKATTDSISKAMHDLIASIGQGHKA
ncbi:MAG: hypothetical protein MUQ43_09635 [Reinekea forsetii]|jgi:hypothetical protein|uniref:Uncharacterized protein n=1 Tax=Reinekea forsetii TaxID=1336806 RepID=A0A2K8KT04_9GAMM|nr:MULTISPECIES: hypothetical protein [Reinekea]ATX77865.1 hypothetical protein REIFOR_02743 [Reinekea forsetii]MDO7640880.1 hypothetical protein [Reinekea forsetii]MDO7645217.1 hypothetical protein [Reinekea forsetii]MDO7674671.1 hypothetical protein [Reinekea forsetii]